MIFKCHKPIFIYNTKRKRERFNKNSLHEKKSYFEFDIRKAFWSHHLKKSKSREISAHKGQKTIKQAWFCHGNDCISSGTLETPDIPVCEHSSPASTNAGESSIMKRTHTQETLPSALWESSIKLNWSKVENCSLVRWVKLRNSFWKTWIKWWRTLSLRQNLSWYRGALVSIKLAAFIWEKAPSMLKDVYSY